jgi:hypothetical protein
MVRLKKNSVGFRTGLFWGVRGTEWERQRRGSNINMWKFNLIQFNSKLNEIIIICFPFFNLIILDKATLFENFKLIFATAEAYDRFATVVYDEVGWFFFIGD